MDGIVKLQIMNWSKYLYLALTVCILIETGLWSQFVEVNAELDMRRLSEVDRQLFETLTVDVENLMEHVKKSGEDVITSKHSHSFFVHPKRLNRVLYQLMAPRLSNGTIKAPDFT